MNPLLIEENKNNWKDYIGRFMALAISQIMNYICGW
jgi:hypothetical protein